VAVNDTVAVLGPGRIGRPIAVTFALGGCRVVIVDLKERSESDRHACFADARREIERDLRLMAEEDVIDTSAAASALARIELTADLDRLGTCSFVQEALPESVSLKRSAFGRLADRLTDDAIVASTSSTISPSHLADAVPHPERFLVAHWLNPAHVIPLVEVVPGPHTAEPVIATTIAFLERMGKVPIRCADSPGFIGPRLQVLLMNEAVRLVEEGVATPEDVDRAFRAGMGFRYATIGLFEFIDWGGVDILYRASRYMAEALGDDRFKPARLVEEKIARNELGPKTGRGFFDYAGEARDRFETDRLRALLRALRRQRAAANGDGRYDAVSEPGRSRAHSADDRWSGREAT
jgi:3-hydroxybutyryl-CoA dehydrogenase